MKEKDSCKTTEALPFDGITGVGQNRSDMSLNYDASGRICADGTRGISYIEYNNDGHPVSIIFDNGNEQRDIWDGLGNHLATEYYTPSSLEGKQPFVTKRYAGDGQIEYQIGPDIGIPNKIPVYTSFPGGYFDQNGKPHYYITDYQGNSIGYPWLSPYAYCTGIVVNKSLSLPGRFEVYSHEANGHGLLYIISGYNHRAASHHFSGSTDTNKILVDMI